MTELDLPTPEPETRETRISWVWLMPLLAVVVALGMLWQTYGDRGPLITVTFPAAEGIEAGVTPLRFRDVEVGVVESLSFSEGLAAIEVHIRLDEHVAEYVDEDAVFWLVRPRVSARGITGLTTVLSGVYIEGSWDGTISGERDEFTALDKAPLASPGQKGTPIVLRARSGGSLISGAPILFNGISVGWIGDPVLSADGLTVTRDAFVEAPFDARLSTSARFWDSSGLSLDIGTSGVSFKLESLAALAEGGVSFGTMVTGGEAVEPGHVFDVFDSVADARADALETVGTQMNVSVLLDAATSGLSTNTIVRFGPTKVGDVIAITGYRDPDFEDSKAQLLVEMAITPERMGFDAGLSPEEKIAELAQRVADGLRLRIASEGILGQVRILQFVEVDDAPEAELRVGLTASPIMPTTQAAPKSELPDGVQGIVTRIGDLPIEALMDSAIGALDSVTAFAGNPDAQELPANANALVEEARAVVGSEDILTALADFQSSANDLKAVTQEIRESEGLASLLKALEASEKIGDNIGTFSERLPGIAQDVEAITTDIQSVPMQELATSLDSLTKRLQAVLETEGIDALPETLRQTLAELRGTLDDLRQGGAVENLNETLATIREATDKVPDLVNRLERMSVTLQGAVAGYAPGSRFEVELSGAVRDISEAARALRSLSRSIERNPGSLIRGR